MLLPDAYPELVLENPFASRYYGDDFTIRQYKEGRKYHLAYTKGDPTAPDLPVRIQSACLPGFIGEASCECIEQLHVSLEIISQSPNGALLLMDEEGRGQGLAVKLQALNNKNLGMDTFEAVEALGLAADVRNYRNAAYILGDLGVTSVRLITNNPAKIVGLQERGVAVTGVISAEVTAWDAVERHLRAKGDRGYFISQFA